MNENDNNSSPEKAPRQSSEMLWIVVAILIAAAMFAAAYFLPVHSLLPVAATASSEQAVDLERRVHTLEDRMNALEARLNNLPQEASQNEQGRVLSATDLEHMQNDLAQMQTAIGAMQDQMKQTGTANQALAHGALAKMVAFVQLRDAARSNRPFVHALETMRAAAKDDTGLKEPLDQLAAYAEGAPDMALLREELAEQSGAAEVANAKAEAQKWWQRILAEFHGLVMIRDVNGGKEGNALDAVKAPLAEDDLSASLDALKNQPAEVRQALGGWRKQAEARLAIDNALSAIADRLAKGGDVAAQPASAPAQAVPDKDTP